MNDTSHRPEWKIVWNWYAIGLDINLSQINKPQRGLRAQPPFECRVYILNRHFTH